MGINAEMRKLEGMLEEMVRSLGGNLETIHSSIVNLHERLSVLEKESADNRRENEKRLIVN